MELTLDETESSPEKVWEACLAIIRDNIPRQSYRTWFGPLRAVSLETEDGMRKLTVQLPSQFYYEWLEEHYYALLRKTVAKILGPNGRLYYKVVIERDDAETGHTGTSVNLPARPDAAERGPDPAPGPVVGQPRLPGAAGQPPGPHGQQAPGGAGYFGPSTPGLFGPDSDRGGDDGYYARSAPDGRSAPPYDPRSYGDRGGDSRSSDSRGHDGRSSNAPGQGQGSAPGQGQSGGQGGARRGRAPRTGAPTSGSGSQASSHSSGSSFGTYAPSQGAQGNRPSGHGSGQPGGGPSAMPPGPGANPFAMPGIQRTPIDSNLNASYVFERFIEGDCNRFARSAAYAVAEQPGGTSFNPLFVYGGVGLGKTHLIQAIGNFARAQRRVQTCLYVSSERFTTEFVQAIKNNRAAEFSLFYRNIDLLIVDDIQFFAGKERTQEEFFHIFNALHQSGKQIVLSSDRPPRDIPDIEERLLSRFQWGLQADVKPPEFETRIAILQRKAEDDGIELDRDVIEFVAHNVKSNIRELEGALIRLIANSTLQNREVDLMLAKDVLRDIIKEVRVTLTVEEIQRVAAEYFGLDERLLRDKTRKREVVLARQVAMFFAKELTSHSLKDIGGRFGGRDHSTVIHGINSIQDQMETDARFRETVDKLRHLLELRSR